MAGSDVVMRPLSPTDLTTYVVLAVGLLEITEAGVVGWGFRPAPGFDDCTSVALHLSGLDLLEKLVRSALVLIAAEDLELAVVEARTHEMNLFACANFGISLHVAYHSIACDFIAATLI